MSGGGAQEIDEDKRWRALRRPGGKSRGGVFWIHVGARGTGIEAKNVAPVHVFVRCSGPEGVTCAPFSVKWDANVRAAPPQAVFSSMPSRRKSATWLHEIVSNHPQQTGDSHIDTFT